MIILEQEKVVTRREHERVFESAESILFLDLEVVTQYNSFY